MALTSVGVEQAREVFNEISNEVIKLTELKEVANFMNSNEEFSRFISGTQFGRENYEKWQKLLNLISSDLYQAMTSLTTATSTFLDRQEQYNSSLIYGSVSGTGPTPISGTTGPSSSIETGNFTGTTGPVYTTPGFKPGENVSTYSS